MDIKEIAKAMIRKTFLETCKQKYACPSVLSLKGYGATNVCTGASTCRIVCNRCWEEAIKDIKFKGEDNMCKMKGCKGSCTGCKDHSNYVIATSSREVNFIEMMKDSAENGTVYEQDGSLYKVVNSLLCFKSKRRNDDYIPFSAIYLTISQLKFTKVEQYKEITAEEAITAIRDGKEVKFDSQGSKRTLDCTAPMSMNTLLSVRFYIKE